MTDVMLFQGPDGGEVLFRDGALELDDTPFTAAYLSLFGGNLEDNGTTASEDDQWWGNRIEPDERRHYRSRTQALLLGLPAITSNIKLVEEAASSDLAWMLEQLAESVKIAVSIPARNKVTIATKFVWKDGTESDFSFTKPWGLAR